MDLSNTRALLLVRNGVDHDARVLRAARVAERMLGGRALILGVATAAAPAGLCMVEGIPVLRLPPRPAGLGRLSAAFSRIPALTKRLRKGAPTAWNPHRPGPAAGDVGPTPATNRLTLLARLRRILSGVSFSVQAILVARKAKPALVQANDWNTMWSGLAMKLAYRTQLVYDSHELWPDRNGRWEWRPWLLASEALFVRIADEVLTSSPGYAEVLSRRYRISRPTIVRNIPERRSAQRDGRPSEPLVVYIGGIMPGRGLEQMIDALPLMPEVRLRAVGPGAASYQADLLERAACAGAQEQIELRPAVSPSEVAAALEHASAGLCLIQPICRSYELCLPNKLFEYAAAGVPVLASDMPVLAAIVRGGGIGEVTATSRPEAIAMSLRRLLEPNCWQLAVRRAQEFADVHGWEVEARTLQAAYTSALNGAGP